MIWTDYLRLQFFDRSYLVDLPIVNSATIRFSLCTLGWPEHLCCIAIVLKKRNPPIPGIPGMKFSSMK